MILFLASHIRHQHVNFSTGKEIFVGTGKRTNFLGAKAVAEAFPEYGVSEIDISASALDHLKDGFSIVGREILAVAPGADCAILLKVALTYGPIYSALYSSVRWYVFQLIFPGICVERHEIWCTVRDMHLGKCSITIFFGSR